MRSRVGFPSSTELVKRNDCRSASNDEVQDDSIAVQIVVDSSSRILSAVAGFQITFYSSNSEVITAVSISMLAISLPLEATSKVK